METADERDAFLLLELAESGRPEEQMAQFIASMIVSSGMDADSVLTFFAHVQNRASELIRMYGIGDPGIWDNLLPGPGGYSPKWKIISSTLADRTEEFVTTLELLFSNNGDINGGDLVDLVSRFIHGDKLIIDPHPEKDTFDTQVLILSMDYPGLGETEFLVSSVDSRERLYVCNAQFYNNLSSPDGDEVGPGHIIEVYSDDVRPFEPNYSALS